ncbi:hypothetical protein UA38_00740 [Photobacterium kishitanii]|uniref:Porin n=1 Tax=Photobacterium kishitanii TaxID=318456 RepID=A0AAX0YWS5_9GAMM|nr:oligogalacturonate-specific porin KdgM family protein [Photobacterium kishitanii]KJG10720.1 hypothetical protein UB40_05000 [Photobacterium kishitanii]KJG59733.1 hypothetical protein UA38_00740 [Photobacterium kishitanii]KJG63021.1 hypothetical protein UA42_01110 [Photobacterium kishitanii]KJG67967.1 hypothetical protein UA40_01730 [Photobacterium kishitanii]KJG71195.1 hypothetical protein UA41_00750 [Photobacterium kishitanii]
MKVKLIVLALGMACNAPVVAEEKQETSFWDLPTKGTFNIRQEYRDGTGAHNNKFQVNLQQGSWLLETIAYVSGGTENEIWSDQKVGTYELGLYNLARISPNIVIVPGFAYSINTNENNLYIPSLRFNYATDNKIRLQARYKQIVTSKNTHRNQAFDVFLGHRFDNGFDFTYQGNITHSISGDILFDNKDTDYFHNLKVTYFGFGKFRPYAEIGDIRVNTTTDDRQLRYRLGIVYAF